MTKKTVSRIYDAAIIGGGFSGLTLACLLGQAGLRIACVDRQDPATAIAADLRTTAISYGSRKILQDAGIWTRALQDQSCPIRDIDILDGASPVLLRFLSQETKAEAFGWITENADLRRAMLARIKVLKGVDFFAPAEILDCETAQNMAVLRLKHGPKINARLVIGADGRGSQVRDWMGVATRGWDYGQRAVICQVIHEHPHNFKAVEHFWPEGPFAVLPMTDDAKGLHRSAVVFTEHGKGGRLSLMEMSDDVFEAALAARFPKDYGAVKLAGKRQAYSLSLAHAAVYTAPRMALVADAAHGIHPIAGQGLNLGFRDVQELAKLLAQAHEEGIDPGGQDLLAAYEAVRRVDNMAMVAVTDGLVRLFSNDVPPVRALRRAGLRMVSKIPAAKRFFMRKAMGE